MTEIFEYRRGDSTRSGNIFVRQTVNSVYKGDNSLRIFGPIVWNNMLPENYKTCPTLTHFKNSIKSWIPKNCPCRLCKNYIPGLGFTSNSV